MVFAFNAPIVYMLGLAFWDKGRGFTLEHYEGLLETPVYLRVLGNTMRIAADRHPGQRGHRLSAGALDARPAEPRAPGRDRAGRAALLGQHPGAHLRLDRHARQWRPGEPRAARTSGSPTSRSQFLYNEFGVTLGMANVLLPFLVLPLYAAMMPHRRSAAAGGGVARRAAAHHLLEGVLPAHPAGAGGGRPAGVHPQSRLLHHAGDPGRRPRADGRQHDRPADQPVPALGAWPRRSPPSCWSSSLLIFAGYQWFDRRRVGMIGGSIWTRRALAAVGIFGLVFLCLPLLIVVPMSFSCAQLAQLPAARPVAALVRGLVRRSALDRRRCGPRSCWRCCPRSPRSCWARLAAYGAAARQLRGGASGRGQFHGADDRAHRSSPRSPSISASPGSACSALRRAGASAHIVLNVP